MAKNLQVKIDFTGDSTALRNAISSLKSEIDTLEKGTKRLKTSEKEKNKTTEEGTKTTKKNTSATKKNSKKKKDNARDGNLNTKSNRLLKRSFATLRSEILLASFAFGTIGSLVGKFIELSNIQEDAEKRLSTALGFRSQKLLDSASALQQVTRFGDEEIIQAQALIASFVNEEDSIIRATEATLDLASAKNMDLRAAADLVSKSIGSSTNALSRYGITVSGAVGSTQRLETAVNGISKAFADTATEDAKTFGGQVKQLANSLSDFGEDVGDAQKNMLTPFLAQLNTATDSLLDNEKAAGNAAKGLMLLAAAFVIMLGTGGIRIAVATIGTLARNIFILGKAAKNSFGAISKLWTRLFGKKGATAVKKFGDEAVPFTKKLQDFSTAFLQSLLAGFTFLQSYNILQGSTKKATEELTDAQKAQLLLDKEMEERNTAALDALKPLVEEQLKQSVMLSSSTKMQEVNNKALFQAMTQVETAIGRDIVLTAEKIEQLGLHGAMVEGMTEKEKELFNTRVALNEQSILGSISDAKATELRISAMAQFGETLASLKPESKAHALLSVRLSQIQAVADAYAAFNVYAKAKRPGLAIMALTQGLANAAMIEKQMSKVQSAATGADFITQGRQMLMVGDNESGREHVQVTPLGNNSRASVGGSSRSVNVNISGNVLGTEEFIRDTLIPEIENTIERNLA